MVLENKGVRTVTVITDRFTALARAQACALQKSGLAFLVIPHPLGGLKEAEVQAAAKVALERLSKQLAASAGKEAGACLPPEREIQPERLTFSDPQQAADYFYRQGWTDGLPVVLPTEKALEEFLRHAGTRQPQEVIGRMPPRWADVTVEKVAVNCILAGCLPEYLPVVLAGVEAVLDPRFNLNGVQSTTHPCGVLLIVNGPAAGKLEINAGHNCFGQGWRANATIGRAMRLILQNIGGGVPGLLDKSTMGQPGKYSYCVAENEAESPWPPFHVERGYPREASTVTVVAAEAPHNVNDHGSTDAEGILTTIAGTMATTGNNNLYHQGDAFLFLGPEHAATIAGDGWSKEDVRRFLFARARVPASKMSPGQLAHIKSWLPDAAGYVDENQTIGICREAADLNILVAGGAGKHSAWIPTFGLSYSVTRPIA